MSKNPVFVESGRRAARVRWGDHVPRVVRLDSLTPEQRRLVVALVNAAKGHEEAAPVSETSGTAMEGDGGSRRAPAAA